MLSAEDGMSRCAGCIQAWPDCMCVPGALQVPAKTPVSLQPRAAVQDAEGACERPVWRALLQRIAGVPVRPGCEYAPDEIQSCTKAEFPRGTNLAHCLLPNSHDL